MTILDVSALDKTEARFLAKVAEPDVNGCHLWTAYVDKDGYGQFRYLGTTVQAHRYAAGMLDWPPEIVTRHTCHTPACVNPEHLGYGSNADNMRDRNEADRQAKGVDHGSAKLTEEQVIEIRRRYADGGVTYRSLAAEYGVHHSVIGYIITRRNWSHLEEGHRPESRPRP